MPPLADSHPPTDCLTAVSAISHHRSLAPAALTSQTASSWDCLHNAIMVASSRCCRRHALRADGRECRRYDPAMKTLASMLRHASRSNPGADSSASLEGSVSRPDAAADASMPASPARSLQALSSSSPNACMSVGRAARHVSGTGCASRAAHWFDTGFLGFDWLSKAIALMLVIMSAIMLAMALLAPYDYAADDSWKVDDPRGGHAAYIWWMSDNHLFSLPSWDTRIVINHVLRAGSGGLWSWNNPPLYYWLTSIPVWLMRALANIMPSLGLDAGDCMKAAQVLQALFTVLLVIACVRFMRRLGFDGIWLAFAGMLMMTIPCLYYASFRVGNDVLMSLFAMLAFTKLIDWWLKPSAMNSVMVGLYAGLAALTKVNGVLVAVVAFIVFMVRLAIWVHERSHESIESNGWKGKNAGSPAGEPLPPGFPPPPCMTEAVAADDADMPVEPETARKMRWRDWLRDAVVFACAFVPLGLGYQVYERMRFGVPFFYVQRPFYPWEPVSGGPVDYDGASFYRGFPWWSRLAGGDCIAVAKPSVDIAHDPCIPVVAVKTFTTSLFRARDGFMLACQWLSFATGCAMLLVLILCLFGMLAHAIRLIHEGGLADALERNPGWLVAAVAMPVWLPFFVLCCYREPAISTPNVRYIMMLFPVFGACIAWVCRQTLSPVGAGCAGHGLHSSRESLRTVVAGQGDADRAGEDTARDAHRCKHLPSAACTVARARACHLAGWAAIALSCVFACACMLTVLTLTVQMGTGQAFS